MLGLTPLIFLGWYSETANMVIGEWDQVLEAVRMQLLFGTVFFWAIQLGIFLDASGDAVSGAQQNVSAINDTFETNGTNGNVDTGHVFVQSAYNVSIRDSYFEYFVGETKNQAILLGDPTPHQASTVAIKDNFFASNGTVSTIKGANTYAVDIEGNTEAATNTTFLNI